VPDVRLDRGRGRCILWRVLECAQRGARLALHVRLGRVDPRAYVPTRNRTSVQPARQRRPSDVLAALLSSAPAASWHQSAEAVTTDPQYAFVRFSVCNHVPHAEDELLATATVPWWCMREGVRALPLDDVCGRRLVRSKLVVRVQMRGDRLMDEHARMRANADIRPPRQLGMLVTYGIDVSSLVRQDDDACLLSFKSKQVNVMEEAGTVRLTVKRKGGDAPCIVFFSTSDGSALAGTDYLPQMGHLFLLRGQKKKEIKIVLVDGNVQWFQTTCDKPR
jgi:hypothetical protein